MTPPCSVPTMNLLGMVGSKLRLLMPGGNSGFLVWADSMQYWRTGEEKFLTWGRDMVTRDGQHSPDVPPLDEPITGASEKLVSCLSNPPLITKRYLFEKILLNNLSHLKVYTTSE